MMSGFDNSLYSENKAYFSVSSWMIPVVLAALLISISFINYLLFHTLAEFFAITIAILTCVVAWNMYPFTRNNYLMYLGGGYFWIGVLDLLHAFSYEGMNIIPGGGANMGVQFWIGTRFLEAFMLLSAPWFLTHTFNRIRYFILYAVAASVIILLIYLGVFPESYIDGKGLTAFKVNSEYVIIALLAFAIYYLYSQREFLEHKIVNVLIVSIILTMCAELAFTFYVSVYGISNIVGHIFKNFSFWLIFQAIIRTTLQEPFLVMSRGATTYDAIPDAAIVVDENGIIRQANNKACLLANSSCDELVGRNNHDVFHPEHLKIENCPVCQAIVTNKELSGYELKIDEAGNWFDFTLSHIKGASRLSGTVEVIRDITQRKLAEKKVKELDILKTSIVDNLPSILFVKDANDHRYVEWNKAAEELTGLLKEEMIGKTDFDFWPKEQAQFFIDKDNEVIKSKSLLNIPEEPLTTKQKGTRTLHTKKIPIYNENGKAKYLLGISDDITEKLKTENMLMRSQKMEAVGQMSGGIAHDFNNQLGVILGYAELLSEQDLNERQITWVAAVKNAAQRCSDLTQQLLIFSRNGEVDKKVVNINEIIKEMRVMIERSLTPEVAVQYFMADNLWSTEINVGACQDVILNIVLNAHDAMPDGGKLIIETSNFILDKTNASSLSLTNLTEGEYVELMINDSGKGMTQDVYEHVFEPFFTTKDVGEGTGLGLSMVYGFVRRYNGDILLETRPGEGATFRIFLPRSKDTASENPELSSEDDVFPPGHENILLVDDEIALLTYAEQLLKGWGYKVFSAENATKALQVLEHSSIDLLFTDVVMPGNMNGYELAVKALEKYPNLKVLITSGFADKYGGNEKYEKYGFELTPKPYKRAVLAEKLRQMLD